MAASEIKQGIFQAYEGESKASIRLQVYAEQADVEGLSGAASLLRAKATAAGVHARNNMRLLGPSQDARSNLSYSLETGTEIARAAYENMMETAESEGDAHAAEIFGWMLDAENKHAELYRRVLEEAPLAASLDLRVCDTCGYIVDGQPPERCPVCGRETRYFIDTP